MELDAYLGARRRKKLPSADHFSVLLLPLRTVDVAQGADTEALAEIVSSHSPDDDTLAWMIGRHKIPDIAVGIAHSVPSAICRAGCRRCAFAR